MKKKWGKGLVSAKDVAEIFNAANDQGAADVPQLSSMDHPQNLHRSLTAAFGHPDGAPEFFWGLIPVKGGTTLHPFLLPHMWFAALFAMRPLWWKTSVRGAVGAAGDYWDNIKHTDFFKSHPGLVDGDLHRTIPVGMHGDGGAFSHHDSFFVLTWNSLLGVGMTRATRFLMTVIPKSSMIPETMPAIMKILVWSFNTMLTGIEPLINHVGEVQNGAKTYLAGKYKACLAQLRGDWDFFTMPSFLAFPKWNEIGRMCWKCLAVGDNANPLKYSRFDKSAPWKKTRQSHEEYIASCSDPFLIPVLFAMCCGFRIEMVMIDVLHCVDLGIASHIVGNIIWILCQRHIFTDDPGRHQGVWRDLNSMAEDNKVQNKFKGHLTPERVRISKDWPKVKSKAAPMHPIAK